MTAAADLACVRCHAALPPVTASTGLVVVCPSCGHSMSSALLVEQASLRPWHAWAGQRLIWVSDRLVAGDLLAVDTAQAISAGASGDPLAAAAGWEPGRATAKSGSTGGAGSLLLAAGALLLVMAGIAFVAYAWDALGPIGQIVTLFAIGALCLLASAPLARRLPGTATAIGLAAWGVNAAGDLDAVGEFAALVGAFLALTFVAWAPSDDAVPIDDPWSWWIAATLSIGSLGLLLAARSLAVHCWPPLAAVGLGAAALALTVFVDETTDPTQAGFEPLISAIVLFGCGIAVLALYALIRQYRVHLMVLAYALGGLSLLLAWTSGSTPSVRPLTALVLFAIGLTCICVNAAMRELGVPIRDAPTRVWTAVRCSLEV